MAAFLVAMPGWTPEMYWRLTLAERNAIVAVLNKRN